MNRRIIWRWFHVRTLKYLEVMLRNRKTRDCIMQKYFRFNASSCIIRSVIGIFISIHLKRISCRIEWFLFQLHSPKHARVIIIILLMIRKAIILAFRSQGVKHKALKMISFMKSVFYNVDKFANKLDKSPPDHLITIIDFLSCYPIF